MKVLSMTGIDTETLTTHSARASSEAKAFVVAIWEIFKKSYYVWKILSENNSDGTCEV